jgi:nucleoid-associated protein YgaU
MGLFDFAATVGAKVFGSSAPKAEEAYVSLKEHVARTGINADGLKFSLKNSVVVAEGQVPSQEIKEKVILIIGNVQGVAQVDDRLTIAGAAPATAAAAPAGVAASGGGGSAAKPAEGWASSTYTVVHGDTLSAIAKKVYGNASKYPVIFEANKPMLKDADHIYPGQVLRIPAAH